MCSRAPCIWARFPTAVALVAAVSGCGGRIPRELASARRAVRHDGLRGPYDLYLAGEFERARDALRRLVISGAVSGPGETSLEQACAFYWLGRSEYALGRIGQARSAAERALAVLARLEERGGAGAASSGHPLRAGRSGARPPGGGDPTFRAPAEIGLAGEADLRAYALTLLSDIALAQRRPAESIALLDRLRREGLEGRAGAADEMLFRRAAALEGVSRGKEAQQAFRRLAAIYPASPLASEAASRARSIGRPVYEARAGVFETRPSAEARARALSSRGLSARVEVDLTGARQRGRAGRRFIVSLGRFTRREDAERAKGRAESEGFSSDISVRAAP